MKTQVVKKSLLVLSVVLAIICVSSLISCNTSSLKGTEWESRDGSGVMTLIFSTKSTGTWIYKRDNFEYDSGSLTYTYDKPTIIVVVDGEVITGTVSKNTMVLSDGNDTIIFTKK
ncbi:MAG: hypothetical protein LBR36_06875 [Bacteroidales bacterium]|jgi:hypothetical protein|nr:hypothetical protein [Bacteroidales bacterium]